MKTESGPATTSKGGRTPLPWRLRVGLGLSLWAVMTLTFLLLVPKTNIARITTTVLLALLAAILAWRTKRAAPALETVPSLAAPQLVMDLTRTAQERANRAVISWLTVAVAA